MLILYAVTIGLSAALLFFVQPMVALMLLPLLGGTPAVWNTAVAFYQFLLLLGYVYAHVLNTRLSVGWQTFLHIVLTLLPLLVLPITLPADWVPPTSSTPLFWVLQVLLVTVGVPFFVVSTTSPLLQSWFARTRHPTTEDPYFLYVASNAGSLIALLGYPLVVQPYLSLTMQSSLWAVGYGLFVVFVLFSALHLWWGKERNFLTEDEHSDEKWHQQEPHPIKPGVSVSVDARQQFRWILLAFVPSSLMLSVTTYLVTNVAPLPLLWIIPLTLYLLTFMWAFSRVPVPPQTMMRWALTVLIPTVLISFGIVAANRMYVWMLIHLVTFFLIALGCHQRLALERPPARFLTRFYLWLSLGGVLGGVFTAIVAPLLFRSVLEYPLVLILTSWVVLGKEVHPDPQERWRDFQLPIVLGGAVCMLIGLGRWMEKDWDTLSMSALLGFGGLVCFAFSARPVRFTLGLVMLFFAWVSFEQTQKTVLVMERNFFGVVRVVEDATSQYRSLMHGTTIHGTQSLEPARRREPLSYYSASSPIGQIFSVFEEKLRGRRIAVVGLGTGSLACYRKPDQHWTFYEIDPTIVQFAQDPQYFTFLDDCAPQADIILGDARLSLAAASANAYALIVLDAYSSDAIPVHLLTREALDVYLAKLANNGLIAFHISNVFFDLKPVVGNLAHDAGLTALVQTDTVISEVEQKQGKYPSVWVVVARQADDLLPLKADARWQELLSSPERPVWTDNFSSVLSVLRRRGLF